MRVLEIITRKRINFMGMESMNNKGGEENIIEKKINYLYDDLSNVDTRQLKLALNGYRNFDLSEDHKAEAIIRIEGELLRRKEMVMEDIPNEDKVFEEVGL